MKEEVSAAPERAYQVRLLKTITPTEAFAGEY